MVMAQLRWGIKTAPQHTTYEAMLEVWKEADRTPIFEHAWLFDHFNPIHSDLDGPCYEGWTTLAALAAQTTRIRLGLMVTGNTYRHLGIGAGWNEYEHASMGMPLYAPGERIRRLGEACEIARRLFTQHLTDFDGRYYQLKQARCEPKPVQKPYPPFVIGGGGEQLTLRIVARYADVWNFAGGPVENFLHKINVLHEHCVAVGRDPREIELSVQVGVNYDNITETVTNVQKYVDAGATHLILNLRYPYPAGIVERLAMEVVPRVTPPAGA
jgi:alkanesulfonate monooxygenase SsuD/methylene tetrahydromethanopterin reductase-like flavin-dependent oxidoreductase (luciferase family)